MAVELTSLMSTEFAVAGAEGLHMVLTRSHNIGGFLIPLLAGLASCLFGLSSNCAMKGGLAARRCSVAGQPQPNKQLLPGLAGVPACSALVPSPCLLGCWPCSQ